MTFLTMSQKEVDQISIFEKLKNKEIKQAQAGSILHCSIRQVKRKLKAYRQRGPASLVHAARGKPGNRLFAPEFKEQVQVRIAEKYSNFGPTFAAEKLLELDNLKVNKETLRGWMSEAGLWHPQEHRQKEVHVWRERRTRFGDLVQLDGSTHAWFEGRGPRCCLIAFIDDATSTVLWAEFCECESTEALLTATTHYFEKEGRPISLYTDRGGVYKVNISNEEGGKVTQYERALNELGVKLIHARSPQAKGRIERLFGTLQDRLVKELRLHGISSMEEANTFLREVYVRAHNGRFAVPPRESTNLHRSLNGFDLPAILCRKETRTLQADWCISYHNRWLQVVPRQQVILAKREEITISHYLDGTLHLSVRGNQLNFKELLERPVRPPREKLLDLRRVGHQPTSNHPWKNDHFINRKRDISKLPERDISILV